MYGVQHLSLWLHAGFTSTVTVQLLQNCFQNAFSLSWLKSFCFSNTMLKYINGLYLDDYIYKYHI